MISKKMVEAITDQINAELYSAYLYMAMSSDATFKGLKGSARWLQMQAQEEMGHAMKFYAYLNDQGERTVLKAIAEPPADFKSLKHMFEETLAHEKMVTGRINDLVDLAKTENDHATEILLQWFVTEQVEEENSAQDVLDKLAMIGDTGPALYMLDRGLGARGAQ